MASIKDVAALAGVSISTVSRVLSGNTPVNEETEKKVKDAISQIGYKPNLVAQGLRSKNTRLIGLIVPLFEESAFAKVISFMEKVATSRNLGLLIANTQDNLDYETEIIESMLRRNIDGIIFSRVSDNSKVMHMIDKQSTPTVIIDRVLKHERIPNIVLDNYAAGELAAQHLWDRGCRKIGTITGDKNISLCRDRLDGFKDKLLKLGYEIPKEYIFSGKFDSETGIRGAEYYLMNSLEIDGIWGQNDLIALGAMSKYIRTGHTVPDDVKLLGMDNIEYTRICYPAMSTIDQPYEKFAQIAFDLLDLQRTNTGLKNKHIVLEPTLIPRETTI